MNPRLQYLHPYPFARLRELLDGVALPENIEPISLAIGEPQNAAPAFVEQALVDALPDVNRYPLALGMPELREAIADWLGQRYGLAAGAVDPATQVLPLQGSREGLFAIAQVVVNPDAGAGDKPLVVMPSPFYQIYEGAALLAGAEPLYVPCSRENSFAMDLSQVTDEQWQRCQLLYLCSPSNPTGYVASLSDYEALLQLADRHDFLIVSDECYSEIYPDEAQPCSGLLQACAARGRSDFSRCLVFNSLSKRSSLAGMRSGFVAGDARLIAAFLRYRTYHGSAMPFHHQRASIAAWRDEVHVQENRALYRENFQRVLAVLQPAFDVGAPAGGFCLWLPVAGDDREFARELYRQQGVTVLPGRFLARDLPGQDNPGEGYVRAALVHSPEACEAAARRIVEFAAAFA